MMSFSEKSTTPQCKGWFVVSPFCYERKQGTAVAGREKNYKTCIFEYISNIFQFFSPKFSIVQCLYFPGIF